MKILIGNLDDLFTEILSEIIRDAIKRKHDVTVISSSYSDELQQIAEENEIDIFILVLNNIIYHSKLSFQKRMENSLHLINHFKMTYKKPVIALSGWNEDSSYITRAKLSADFFFPIPFETDAFGKAIRKCLDLKEAE